MPAISWGKEVLRIVREQDNGREMKKSFDIVMTPFSEVRLDKAANYLDSQHPGWRTARRRSRAKIAADDVVKAVCVLAEIAYVTETEFQQL